MSDLAGYVVPWTWHDIYIKFHDATGRYLTVSLDFWQSFGAMTGRFLLFVIAAIAWTAGSVYVVVAGLVAYWWVIPVWLLFNLAMIVYLVRSGRAIQRRTRRR